MYIDFGFMLVWGDLIYVPFWYSVIGWWIADYTEKWSTLGYIGLLAFHFAFHFLFRTSNW
jgi:Delta14-sterol reductase